MSVTNTEVKRIAHLARLSIDGKKQEKFTKDFCNILGFIEQMQQVNTKGIVPLVNPLDETQRMRTDRITESDQRELFQQNAPLAEAGLYLVPKVIDA